MFSMKKIHWFKILIYNFYYRVKKFLKLLVRISLVYEMNEEYENMKNY